MHSWPVRMHRAVFVEQAACLPADFICIFSQQWEMRMFSVCMQVTAQMHPCSGCVTSICSRRLLNAMLIKCHSSLQVLTLPFNQAQRIYQMQSCITMSISSLSSPAGPLHLDAAYLELSSLCTLIEYIDCFLYMRRSPLTLPSPTAQSSAQR